MFGQIFHIKLWLEFGLQQRVLVMIKGCFFFHHSPKPGPTCPWHSSESWTSGHQFISTTVKGSKINTCSCMHKTVRAHLLLRRLFSSCMRVMVPSICRLFGLWNHPVCMSAKTYSKAWIGAVAIWVCMSSSCAACSMIHGVNAGLHDWEQVALWCTSQPPMHT